MIGKRIRSLREDSGLTQLQLADILNISNTTLSQYENGFRVPSDDIKIEIAKYFNVTLDSLFGLINNRSCNEQNKPWLETVQQLNFDYAKLALYLQVEGINPDAVYKFVEAIKTQSK